ncbi:Imidazoleglycerol-phosphate dehydratase [Lactococcus lactis]|nr:Imidazoleglycerol-phosphate dehydratase [Lactococcus lactis]
MTRISHITRNTKETQIELSINLDGTGQGRKPLGTRYWFSRPHADTSHLSQKSDF